MQAKVFNFNVYYINLQAYTLSKILAIFKMYGLLHSL